MAPLALSVDTWNDCPAPSRLSLMFTHWLSRQPMVQAAGAAPLVFAAAAPGTACVAAAGAAAATLTVVLMELEPAALLQVSV